MQSKLRMGLIVILLFAAFFMYWQIKHRHKMSLESSVNYSQERKKQQTPNRASIEDLTQYDRVASYLHAYQQLPNYYIKKFNARQLGWLPVKGNLCEVLPGKAIGGDKFSNREGLLPGRIGRKWFEADVNYRCGRRSTDRLLYSSDGLIYLTQDHYRNFRRLF